MFIDTTEFEPKDYLAEVKLWDVFHAENPSAFSLTLVVRNYFASEFETPLAPKVTVAICSVYQLELPSVIDIDGDFSHIEISGNISWISIDSNSVLAISPTKEVHGNQIVKVVLFDDTELLTEYQMQVEIADDHTYEPIVLPDQKVVYPYLLQFSVASAINTFLGEDLRVEILENGSVVVWVRYNESTKMIKVEKYELQQVGSHKLTVSITNSCLSKTRELTVLLTILSNKTPVAT